MDDIEMNEYMVMNLGSKRNKEQRTKKTNKEPFLLPFFIISFFVFKEK